MSNSCVLFEITTMIAVLYFCQFLEGNEGETLYKVQSRNTSRLRGRISITRWNKEQYMTQSWNTSSLVKIDQ